MGPEPLVLRPVGRVESPLRDREQAPKQGDEGAPEAWIVFDASVADALADLRVGDEVLVLTWLDRARRDVLRVHPRGDPSRPATGVFSTRSPDRPNPLGLHRVTVLAIEGILGLSASRAERGERSSGPGEGIRVRVRDLEALDGTPVVDVKPVLGPVSER